MHVPPPLLEYSLRPWLLWYFWSSFGVLLLSMCKELGIEKPSLNFIVYKYHNSAKTFRKVIINISNRSLHGHKNLVAQGVRASTFTNLYKKFPISSLHTALHFLNAFYVSGSLDICGQALDSFYFKCAKH